MLLKYFNIMINLQCLKLPTRNLGLTTSCRFTHGFRNKDVKFDNENEQNEQKNSRQIPALSGAVQKKYNVFRDVDATEIFDVVEERRKIQEIVHDKKDLPYEDDDTDSTVDSKRKYGVFDIENLVDILHKENVEDIFVCYVPKSLKYVDYLVVCHGRSYKHMLATAEFVRHTFKEKRRGKDILPKIEGEKSRDWMAMDLGNIALHIFSSKAREEYDLESLWAIGTEYDTENNKSEEPYGDIFLQSLNLIGNTNLK